MHGRLVHRTPYGLLFLFLAPALGCGSGGPQAPPDARAQVPDAASRFNPAATGSVTGRVVWEGDLPVVPDFEAKNNLLPSSPPPPRIVRENPNTPAVHPSTRGVGNAIVFLRGVDPAAARPWDHPPVSIEQCDLRLQVVQGAAAGRVGIVRRGDAVTFVSKEKEFHALQARGAAFFTLPFPDPDRPASRRLLDKGLVELTSAAGYFWMRGYLFVDDHPYYARTDAEGRFVMPQVPCGRYEVVCWLPNWKKERHERDPESTLILRVFFHPPLERAQTVAVEAGGTHQVEFKFSAADFER
jgi:hypothetical protein